MNNKIHDILAPKINKFTNKISYQINGNGAIFGIFDSFFNELKANPKVSKKSGVKLNCVVASGQLFTTIDISTTSFQSNGITFIVDFDGVMYSFNFVSFKDGQQMIHRLTIKSSENVYYSGDYLYKYFLYNALEVSTLKGSYFSMPRDKFSWEVKDIEVRDFNDIFLSKDITDDLHLYVDIFKGDNRLLRYLKVGPPGTAKTESTLVIANELNKMGVTILKTPICDKLHEKVELANILSPCLIVFDDIDLSLGSRNSGYSQLLGDFLDVLDGTDKLNKGVGVIATTNAAHLLDLAAQRPGRFDKTLLFDNISLDNIKGIMAKSLRINFGITKGPEFTLYTNDRIAKSFHDAGVTDSHVYNSIKMLKLRFKTLKTKNVTVDTVLNSINTEIETIKRVRKVSYLNDKMDRGSGNVGFSFGDNKGLKDEDSQDAVEEVWLTDSSTGNKFKSYIIIK